MKESKSVNIKRSAFDRRSDTDDRRKHYDINFIDKIGRDRRKHASERRSSPEKRTGWVRVSQWSSICVASLTS